MSTERKEPLTNRLIAPPADFFCMQYSIELLIHRIIGGYRKICHTNSLT